MKKFNLKKALAGEPVVTRDGDRIIEIVRLKKVPSNSYSSVVVVAKDGDGCVYSFDTNKSGQCSSLVATDRDLFMADPKPVKKPAPKKPVKPVKKSAARKKAR